MPATTYSPTHFRVQYHRPSGLNHPLAAVRRNCPLVNHVAFATLGGEIQCMKVAKVLSWSGILLLLLSLTILWMTNRQGIPLNPWLVALAALGLIGILLLLWFIPKVQSGSLGSVAPRERFDSENEARKGLAQIFGG